MRPNRPSEKENRESVLIVDDQVALCETLKRYLRKRGYRTNFCTSVDEALKRLAEERFDLVLTDLCMPDKDGMYLLTEIKARGHDESVIIMTAYATIDQSVEAMRRGASDYITKPFRLEVVATTIEQTLLRRRRQPGNNAVGANGNGHLPHAAKPSRLSPQNDSGEGTSLVGKSPVMAELFDMVERIAPTDSSVLITGSTGTGKELVARQIHAISARRTSSFVDINCSAIPDTLIEAELFGHQRGTFTGANETRSGLFEEASGGTLFLDEIDALDLSSQAKLLRVLQERKVRRVGGRKNIPVDVRVISATNKNLHQAVSEGTFRADLLYRLCVLPMHIPDLRERGEDLALLVEHFLRRHSMRRGITQKTVSPEALKAILSYDWPGNVRELENAIEYALVMTKNGRIELSDLLPNIRSPQAASSESEFLVNGLAANASLSEVQRRYILLMLERHNGHKINTANALGIDRRTLLRKLQQYGAQILRNESPSRALASGVGF